MRIVGEYKLTKLLGSGTYGEIYLAKKDNDPTLYAVKVLDRKRMDSPKMQKYFNMELEILMETNHPNIAHFYKKLQDESNYYIIMEYCNGGTLKDCFKKYISLHKETFPIEIIQHFMNQIIRAFCHIHSQNIIHRDVKLENILLSFDDERDKENLNLMQSKIKLIDFGCSTKLENSKKAFTVVGSPITMSPLILRKYNRADDKETFEGYTEKEDIWSLGIIFYQLLTGEYLFHANDLEELMKKIEEGNYVIPMNKNFYKETVSFLNCMLQYNPDKRLSAQDLAQHDFITKKVINFTKVDLNQISNKIDIKGLNNNIKQNDTIRSAIDNKKGHNQNQYEEKGYSFNASIYSSNNAQETENIKTETSSKINEKEEVTKYIKGLLYEYKAAKEYFNKNGFVEQEKDANEKYIQLKSTLRSFEEKSFFKFESLPKPITPEYIYGCSASKRNSIFQEIINVNTEKKNDLKVLLDSSMMKYKKMGENKFMMIKDKVIPKINNDKLNIKKLEDFIEYIQQQYNNKWIPAPEIERDLEMRTFEKINFDGCDFKLRIHLTKNNYYNTTNNFVIRMSLKINENREFKGYFKILNHGNFEEDITWNLKYNEWNNLSNYFINVDFYIDKQFKGNQKIKIGSLKNEPVLSLNYPIPFVNQPVPAIFNFNVSIDIPEGKIYTVNEMKNVINIKKYYPAFEGKSPFTNKIPKMFL